MIHFQLNRYAPNGSVWRYHIGLLTLLFNNYTLQTLHLTIASPQYQPANKMARAKHFTHLTEVIMEFI
ncbi:hypothetical protein CHUAL_013032 [Chamberlinius hualienensis]